MYLSKLPKIFVQIAKCIYPVWQLYLSNLPSVFVQIAKLICPNYKIYLSKIYLFLRRGVHPLPAQHPYALDANYISQLLAVFIYFCNMDFFECDGDTVYGEECIPFFSSSEIVCLPKGFCAESV